MVVHNKQNAANNFDNYQKNRKIVFLLQKFSGIIQKVFIFWSFTEIIPESTLDWLLAWQVMFDKCGQLVKRIKSLLFGLEFWNLNIENLAVRVFSVEKFVKRTWWNINCPAVSKSQHKCMAYFMQHYQRWAFPKEGFHETVL